MAFGSTGGAEWSPGMNFGIGGMLKKTMPSQVQPFVDQGWQKQGMPFDAGGYTGVRMADPNNPANFGIMPVAGAGDLSAIGVGQTTNGGYFDLPQGGSQVSQQDIDAMIKAAMDPFLDQMRQYQTSLQDMYSQPRSGPFDFLNAPMTFNKPQNGQFMRPSYGAPVDRGFNPGGWPSFSAPPVPSGVEGLGGMFFDPYLATLAETLFGGASWLPEAKAPDATPTIRPPSLKQPRLTPVGMWGDFGRQALAQGPSMARDNPAAFNQYLSGSLPTSQLFSGQ